MEFKDREKYKNKKGIYGIVNKVNNKIYIGQTKNKFRLRFTDHDTKLRNDYHDNSNLQEEYNCYGDENFEFIILEVVEDISLLDKLEIEYIAKYKELNMAYNILDGNIGPRYTPKTKRNPIKKEYVHTTDRRHSEETIQKMIKTRTGKDYLWNKKTNVLNDELARTIKALIVSGENPSNVSKETNIPYKLINNIISNNAWKHVFVEGWDEYYNNRPRLQKKKITDEDVRKMRELYQNGERIVDIAKMFNRDKTLVGRIVKYEARQNVI